MAWGSSGHAQTPLRAVLFVPAAASARDSGAPVDLPPGSLRARATGLALSALQANALRLDLFPGRSLNADLVRRQRNADGSLSWSGQVPGDPLSTVTFVQAGEVVQGSIRLHDVSYSVEPRVGLGSHMIREVDPQSYRQESVPLVASPRQLAFASPDAVAAADDGSTIDVFVAYTALARAEAGGTDEAIRARINLGITETNTAYGNSGVLQRLRLIGTELVGYFESGDIGRDLQRLTDPEDGVLDLVHARRDAVGADLVSLIVGSSSQSCGVAWLMDTPVIEFAALAFSVVVYDCISPNYTFGHEFAHNMGAAHAPEDPNSRPAFPYAYAYKDPAAQFRTIMAYDCLGGCPRILFFSNPSSTFAGRPTGTPQQHNNALALNNTRFIVANFRQSAAEVLGAPESVAVTTAGTTATLTWTAPSVGTVTGYVIEVGSLPGFANLSTATVGAGATTFVMPSVPQGSYYLRVRGVGATGLGPPSAEVQLLVTAQAGCVELPPAPTLAAAVVSGNTVSLSWSVPVTAGGPTDYLVGAGYSPGALNAAVIQTGSASTTLTAAAEPGQYFVRVAGRNACGVGPSSNEVLVTVAPPSLPDAPLGLSASVAAGGLVTLTWNAPASGGPPQSYVLQAGYSSGESNIGTMQTGPSASFVVRAPPGSYFVRVRAANAAGVGPPSAELRVVVP
jgi:hypothetical protein